MWCELAELSSVFRFRATSDSGSRSSWWNCCELSPIFKRSSFFAWNEFCDSSKRNCCWCKRFLMRKIFGIFSLLSTFFQISNCSLFLRNFTILSLNFWFWQLFFNYWIIHIFVNLFCLFTIFFSSLLFTVLINLCLTFDQLPLSRILPGRLSINSFTFLQTFPNNLITSKIACERVEGLNKNETSTFSRSPLREMLWMC